MNGQKKEAKASGRTNAKGRGRGTGSRDRVNTFEKVTPKHTGLGDATQPAAEARGGGKRRRQRHR